MWRLVLAALAALSVANGLYMWFTPEAWYHSVPGVPMTGPLNLHFVPDIAMIFLVSGGAFHSYVYATEVPEGYQRRRTVPKGLQLDRVPFQTRNVIAQCVVEVAFPSVEDEKVVIIE